VKNAAHLESHPLDYYRFTVPGVLDKIYGYRTVCGELVNFYILAFSFYVKLSVKDAGTYILPVKYSVI